MLDKKYGLKNEYDSELMDYVNTKGFDINNLSKYKEYKKNNIDASIEDTIKIVNLGLNICNFTCIPTADLI